MKEIKGFKNCNILIDDKIVKTSLLIKDGKIRFIGKLDKEEGLVELDDDKIVVPGFIDEHIHGAAGSDAMDGTIGDLEKIACAIAKEGTTAFLATTMTQSKENIDKALKNVNDYMKLEKVDGAKVLGVHLEGPFISLKHVGAQPIEFVQEPTVANFKHYEEASGNNIKLVTLAPEVEGAMDLVKYLASKGIVASIGHSDATYNDCLNAIKNGASNVTHTYNAQKGLHHREIGVVGSAMLFDELNCEAICDGIHLSAPAIKLLVKNKKDDKFTLITDAMRAKHMPDGVSELGGQTVYVKGDEARLADGTLAGSVLKMNRAIANVMKFTDLPLEKVVSFATINPAKNLHVFDLMGSIEVNKYANFAIIDKDVNVYQTIREGKIIFNM